MVETARPTVKNFWRGVKDGPVRRSGSSMSEQVTDKASFLTKRYYRVDEVARYFSVSDRTIYRLIDMGDLKVIRLRACVRIAVGEIKNLEARLGDNF